MWIFLNHSFLSIVENTINNSESSVCPRIKSDIENVFPKSEVLEIDKSDYKYHPYIKKNDLPNILKDIVEKINYDNLQNSIPYNQTQRHNSRLSILAEFRKIQK